MAMVEALISKVASPRRLWAIYSVVGARGVGGTTISTVGLLVIVRIGAALMWLADIVAGTIICVFGRGARLPVATGRAIKARLIGTLLAFCTIPAWSL